MKFRLWAARSGGVALIAGFLSLSMVTPSVAVDGWIPDEKPLPAEERYKFGYDYYKKEMGTGQTYTYKFGDKIPVSGSVNPSGTTSSVPLNTSNTPLTGKIIEPAKTPAKPPAVYTRLPTLISSGALGASKLLGTAGVGIGGASAPVGNFREIALAQGVSSACLDSTGPGVCTSDEISKQFKISSCSHLTGTSSCSSIGAKNADGSPMTNLMETAIPLAADLWAWLTGQGGKEDTPINGHYDVTTNGCKLNLQFKLGTGNNGTFQGTRVDVKPNPGDGIQGPAWNNLCGSANPLQALNASADRIQTECVQPSTGMTGSGGQNFGIDLGMSLGDTGFVRSDGTNVANLCDSTAYVLMRIKVFNSQPQSYYSGWITNSNGAAVNYMEWINPDPNLETITDTTITTNWTCRDRFGTEHQLSRSITKISALVEPACPVGTDLVKHDVQSTKTGAPSTTIDSGTENTATKSSYPLCIGQPCALSVQIDGVTCSSINTACGTWPQIYASSPSRVKCQWGTYTLPTDNCLTLSNAYKTETGVVFEPKSQTWTAIDIFGKPVAPNPEPWNPTNPTPQTGQQPGTAPATGTATGGFPSTGANPSSHPSTSNGCMGTSWSWNPIDWIVHPVACVLEWAFEPGPNTLQNKGGEIHTQLQVIGVSAPFDNLNATLAALPQGQGCEGPSLTFSIRTVSETMQPFNACSGVMNTVANSANALGSVYLLLFGSVSVVRAISGAFGYTYQMGKTRDN